MRVLALDYGSSKCGVAISDPSGTLARPIDPIEQPGSEAGLGRITRLVDELGVERIVVGLPIGLAGHHGAQAAETEAYVAHLREHVTVPIERLDERFTTKIAQRTVSEAKSNGAAVRSGEDSIAAAHLLSNFLDSQHRAS